MVCSICQCNILVSQGHQSAKDCVRFLKAQLEDLTNLLDKDKEIEKRDLVIQCLQGDLDNLREELRIMHGKK